jgi:hypothetical protein
MAWSGNLGDKLVSDALVDTVKGVTSGKQTVQHGDSKHDLKVGDSVTITEGPFSGRGGVITGFKSTGKSDVQIVQGNRISIYNDHMEYNGEIGILNEVKKPKEPKHYGRKEIGKDVKDWAMKGVNQEHPGIKAIGFAGKIGKALWKKRKAKQAAAAEAAGQGSSPKPKPGESSGPGPIHAELERDEAAFGFTYLGEAKFMVKVDGIGEFIIDGKSGAEVKSKVKKNLRNPKSITSIERMSGPAAKKYFMGKAAGKSDQEEEGEDEPRPTHGFGREEVVFDKSKFAKDLVSDDLINAVTNIIGEAEDDYENASKPLTSDNTTKKTGKKNMKPGKGKEEVCINPEIEEDTRMKKKRAAKTEEADWEVAQYWDEETVADFLKRGGKITKLKPRAARGSSKGKMKSKGGRETGLELSRKAHSKMHRNEYTPDHGENIEEYDNSEIISMLKNIKREK